MSFKFEFQDSSTLQNSGRIDIDCTCDSGGTKLDATRRHSSYADVGEVEGLQLDSNSQVLVFEKEVIMTYVEKVSNLDLFRRTQSDINYTIALNDNMDSQIQSITLDTDLVKGVYEGGLKTWECSIDLVNYILANPIIDKKVLELGCGSGLPGITCLKTGASMVDFQDYNEDVLRFVTLPNVLINQQSNIDCQSELAIEIPESMNHSKFIHGGWDTLLQLFRKQEKYDIILSCETIYDSSNYVSQLTLITECLSRQGYCLVAGKYNYFGCSGSMPIFKQYCQDFGFKVEVVYASSTGIRNEIIKISKS